MVEYQQQQMGEIEACSRSIRPTTTMNGGQNVNNQLGEAIKWILCISGKRKSGKDFVTRYLAALIQRECPQFVVSICVLSEPLKEEFAALNGLDAAALMGDGQAKETVRAEMIEFGERQRAKDSAIFCRKAMPRRKRLPKNDGKTGAEQFPNGSAIQNGVVNEFLAEIVLVSDCRRPTDVQFFKQCADEFHSTKILCIRVDSPLEARIRRGFVSKAGVDDAESECALDGFEGWDFRVENDRDGSQEELEAKLAGIIQRLAQST